MALSQCLSDPLDWDWDRGGGRGSSSGRSTRISRFGRPAAALAACKPTVSPPFFKKNSFSRLSPDLEMTFATGLDIGHNSRLGLGLSEDAI